MEETKSVVEDGVEGVLSRAASLERSVGGGDVLDGLLRAGKREKRVSERTKESGATTQRRTM